MHDEIIKEISSLSSTLKSTKNNIYTVNVVIKALSKMDRRHFWSKMNESVGYGHPITNQLCNVENDEVYLNLDKKVKLVILVMKMTRVYCTKSKF